MASSSESVDSKWVAGNAILSRFASIASLDQAVLARNKVKPSVMAWLGLGAAGTSVLDDLAVPALAKWVPGLAIVEPAALIGVVGIECLGSAASGSVHWFEARKFKQDLSNAQMGLESLSSALSQRDAKGFKQALARSWSSCSALASRLESGGESLALPGSKPLSAAGFEQWVATRYLGPAIEYAKSVGLASEGQASRWSSMIRVQGLKDRLREDLVMDHAKLASPMAALDHPACVDQPPSHQGRLVATAGRALDDLAFPAMAAAGLAITEPVWMVGGVALLCALAMRSEFKLMSSDVLDMGLAKRVDWSSMDESVAGELAHQSARHAMRGYPGDALALSSAGFVWSRPMVLIHATCLGEMVERAGVGALSPSAVSLQSVLDESAKRGCDTVMPSSMAMYFWATMKCAAVDAMLSHGLDLSGQADPREVMAKNGENPRYLHERRIWRNWERSGSGPKCEPYCPIRFQTPKRGRGYDGAWSFAESKRFGDGFGCEL